MTATAGNAHDRASMPGIAVFVMADIASFMLFFGVFMADRLQAPAAFAASASKLDVSMGLVNTLVLITSGWCVAQAEKYNHLIPGSGRRWLFAALPIGAIFFVLKFFEYRAKIEQGITPATDLFFTYYFVFTGVHLAHYIAGMTILTIILLRNFSNPDQYTRWLRAGALYWHMVDVLWLFLFPLLYLQVRT